MLEPSIKQINEHTDIIVSVAQHKTGRSVTGFSFRFKQKPQPKVEQKTDPKRDPNTPDFFVEMTDAQRYLFAHKLSELPEVGSEYAEIGESAEEFTKRLADMLLEPKNLGCFTLYWNSSALVLRKSNLHQSNRSMNLSLLNCKICK